MSGVIDLKTQRFLKDCKDYLRTGEITDSLRTSIINNTPGYLEFIKRNLSKNELKIVEIVVEKVTTHYRKSVTSHRQKINIICQTCIENLETYDSKFAIPEIIERYRESINPIKALYYDLQEILFLYDGKPKNKHHKFLIKKFSTNEDFIEILETIDRDIENLHKCKVRVLDIKEQYKIPGTSEYYKKVIDIHNEMKQWKALFIKFPDWVKENSEEDDLSLFDTLCKFFKHD